jgi:hypothetical protein
MFIERTNSKRLLLAPAERNSGPTWVPLPETLRSAGARVMLTIGSYKHSAPLDDPNLVAAWAALCNLRIDLQTDGE